MVQMADPAKTGFSIVQMADSARRRRFRPNKLFKKVLKGGKNDLTIEPSPSEETDPTQVSDQQSIFQTQIDNESGSDRRRDRLRLFSKKQAATGTDQKPQHDSNVRKHTLVTEQTSSGDFEVGFMKPNFATDVDVPFDEPFDSSSEITPKLGDQQNNRCSTLEGTCSANQKFYDLKSREPVPSSLQKREEPAPFVFADGTVAAVPEVDEKPIADDLVPHLSTPAAITAIPELDDEDNCYSINVVFERSKAAKVSATNKRITEVFRPFEDEVRNQQQIKKNQQSQRIDVDSEVNAKDSCEDVRLQSRFNDLRLVKTLGRSPESINAEREYGSFVQNLRSEQTTHSFPVHGEEDQISPCQSFESIGSHSRSTRLSSFGALSVDGSEMDEMTFNQIGLDLSEMALELREKGPSVLFEWMDFGPDVKEKSRNGRK